MRKFLKIVGVLVGIILGLLTVIAVGRRYIINPYRIPGESMHPSIEPGQVVWGYMLAYGSPNDVHRGDIIVHLIDGVPFPKRVLGIPGDKIEIDGDRIVLNQKEVVRTEISRDNTHINSEETLDRRKYVVCYEINQGWRRIYPKQDLVVPENTFYLLCDNRSKTKDSRLIGVVQFSDIVGRIIGRGPIGE